MIYIGIDPGKTGAIAMIEDGGKITVNAMKSAFAHFDDRISLIYGRIKPGFEKAKS